MNLSKGTAVETEQIRSVIFDMDGLLLDTERLAFAAFKKSCQRHKIIPNEEVYLDCIGGNWQRTEQVLIAGHGPEFPYQAISASWSEIYFEQLFSKPIPVKEGAIELLQLLGEKGIDVGLATSSKYETAVRKLKHSDLFDFFDVIMTGDKVTHSKPDPEIYLQAAAKLDTSPEHCLALEDSDNGVRAAHGANIPVIQIPDLKQPSPQVQALAHPVLNSLEDVIAIFRNTR